MVKHEHPDLSFLVLDVRLILPLFLVPLLTLSLLTYPLFLAPIGGVIGLLLFLPRQRGMALLALVLVLIQAGNLQVRSYPIFFDSGSRSWVAEVKEKGSLPGSYQVQVRPEKESGLQAGTLGRLEVPNTELLPGDRLAFRGSATASKFGISFKPVGKVEVLDRAESQFIAYRLLAEGLIERAEPTDIGLFLGMTYGDDSLIDRDDRTNYHAVGITHLTAVSGSNIGLVAASTFWLAAVIFRRRRVALAFMFSLTLLYCLFVGFEGSVVRALVFALVGCTAAFTGASKNMLGLCSSTILLLIFANPLLIWDVGFVLSAAITLGIVLLCPPLHYLLSQRFGEVIAAFFSINLVADIVSTPLSAFYFGEFYPYSLLANMLVAPLVPVVLFLGICYLLVFIVSGQTLPVFFHLAEPLLNLIEYLAEALARFSGSVLTVHSPLVLGMLCGWSLLVSCIIVRAGRRQAGRTPEPLILL